MKILLLADPLVRRIGTGGIDISCKNQRDALRGRGIALAGRPSETFDILHVHLNPLSPLTVGQLLAFRRRARKTILHCHSTKTDFADTLIYSRLLVKVHPLYLRAACGLADLVLCPSDFARSLLESYGVKTPIRTIGNGVDLGRFAASPEAGAGFRREYGLAGEVIVSVGFVFPRKGIFDFIDVAGRFPDVRFFWAGKTFSPWLTARPWTTRKRLRRLPPNTAFAGYVPDIVGAYNAADIFLFPSHAENQGMAILEAAAVGTPIIVRDLPVYRDWLVHGENCLKASDVEGFAVCIRRLRKDAGLREKLRRQGKITAEANSLEAVGRELEGIYRELLDGPDG
jgi:1,2-diacylglycerol-3-alpha-glucose alpha-1,2-glucosyltransferase